MFSFVLLTVLASSPLIAQDIDVVYDYFVSEGGSVEFTVKMSCPTFDVPVAYSTEDGSAIAGSDYVATSGTLTFESDSSCSGKIEKTFSISTTSDTDYEGDETFYVEFIHSDTHAAWGSYAVLIGDDDPDDPDTWTNDPVDYETTVPVRDEDDNPVLDDEGEYVYVDTVLVGVNPCGPEVSFADQARDYLCECYYTYDEGFQLYYDENDGKVDPERTYFTCDEGKEGVLYGYKRVRLYDDYNDTYYYDYDLTDFGELEIPEPEPFGGEPLDDEEYEEQLDYSQLSDLNVSVEDAYGYEDARGEYGDGSLTFVVSMDAPRSTDASVRYTTVDGSAVAGEDYVATSGRLDFNVGQFGRVSRTFTVRVLNDEQYEGSDETFTVRIIDPSDDSVLAEATGTISDDGRESVSFTSGVSDKVYMARVWITPTILPPATGGLCEVAYSLAGLPGELLFDGPTRTLSGYIHDADVGEYIVTYEAVDGSRVEWDGGVKGEGCESKSPDSDSLKFRITIIEYDDVEAPNYGEYIDTGSMDPVPVLGEDSVMLLVLEEAEEPPVTLVINESQVMGSVVSLAEEGGPVLVTVDERGNPIEDQISLKQYLTQGGSPSDLYVLQGEEDGPVVVVLVENEPSGKDEKDEGESHPIDPDPYEPLSVEVEDESDEFESSSSDVDSDVDPDSQKDLDPYPQLASLSITIDDVTSAAEHGRMTFTVRLQPAPTAPTAVKYATASRTAKAGVDYKVASDTLHFEVGQSTAQFTVRIHRDELDEPDEAFAVRITHPSTGALLAEAMGTITDDDEQAEGEKADGQSAFAFAEEVKDQAYTAGTAISALQLPEAVGGQGEITYRVLGLPSGLSFDDSTRTISGTPAIATEGAVEIAYLAQGSTGATVSLIFFITVNPPLSFDDLFAAGKATTRSQLFQNAPNPFNSQTVLSYFLRHPSSATVEVFSLTGQRVALLHQGPQQPGVHRLHWNGRDDFGRPVASGMYLYRLVTDERVLTRKLILLR